MAESDGPSTYLNPMDGREKGTVLLPRLKPGCGIIISGEDSGLQLKSQLILSNQSTDSDSAWTSSSQPQASPVVQSTAGLPKGYTPIPTLLAKSVGNKVTLMNRPADYSGVNNKDRKKRGSLPTSAVITVKAQNSPSVQQNTGGLQQAEVHTQPAALPKPVQAKPRQAITKNPFPVNCMVPETRAHLTESSSPAAISVRPFVNQTAGENVPQQVVILPSKFLIQKDNEGASPLPQQQAAAIQGPVSNISGPVCMSTNVPGFTIPENKIPVQQVAPLKNTVTLRTPVSLRPQEEVANTAGFKVKQIWNPPFSFSKSTEANSSFSTTPSSSSSTELCKSPDQKQELRTVCIRDSQSILVTTRGGNTGIVKVQSSSDQNALGSFSVNPVITISPQLKAFLVSKATQNLSTSAPAQTSCTIPAVTSISGAQTHRPVSTATKSHDTLTIAGLPTVSGSIPTLDPRNTNTAPAFAKGPNVSISSTVAESMSPCTQAASIFQLSAVKNTVIPSLSHSSPQVVPQAESTNKTSVKRASTEEISQHTKFILVSPSSLSTVSNVTLSKSPPSSTRSLPTSGVMFIGQPPATSASTSAGTTPTQPLATLASGPLQNTSLPNLTIGLRAGQPVGNLKPEASKLKNITLPSGECSEPVHKCFILINLNDLIFSLSLQELRSTGLEGRQ